MDAERAQLWNSPNMLRARAWLHDYCSKSARVTPEQAQEYMTELENMTPTQMKLWLLKFEHEEEQRQQQYAAWQKAHELGLRQAMAANRAAQQSLADVNREQSQAALGAQQQLEEQQQITQERQVDMFAPHPYGYSPWAGGLYPTAGGIHYHYHIYPYR